MNIHYDVGENTTSTFNTDFLSFPSVPDYSQGYCSDKYDNERELMGVLQMEAWNKFGVEISYYPVSYDIRYDELFGEDGNRYVVDEWTVMSAFQLPKENKVWDKFGIDGINNFSMFISKDHFRFVAENYIPKMGDLIIAVYDNKMYEIVEVKEESNLFLLSKQFTWELIVRQAKIESDISVIPELKDSRIGKIYKTKEIFDISNNVENEKTEVIYKQENTEQNPDDPFGGW